MHFIILKKEKDFKNEKELKNFKESNQIQEEINQTNIYVNDLSKKLILEKIESLETRLSEIKNYLIKSIIDC